MKKVIYYLIVSFLIIFQTTSNAQLKEFEIKPLKPPEIMPVFTNYPDDAAIFIYSSLNNLNFESNTGGIVDITVTPDEGKYTLIVKTERQVITVKLLGYMEEKLRLAGLEARSVQYYSIETKHKLIAEKGRFRLDTNPQGAYFEIEGLPVKGITPYESEEFLATTYKILIRKEGYKNEEVLVTIEAGKTVSKTVDLTMDIAGLNWNKLIKNLKTTSTLVKNYYFEADGQKINILFDLAGDPEEDYVVGILLKSNIDRNYSFKPELVTGAVGEGKFAGTGKKIVWDAGKELAGGLTAEELYIEISVEEVSGFAWYYYLGGAILGGVGAYFLIPPPETVTPDGGTTIVDSPPGRPGN